MRTVKDNEKDTVATASSSLFELSVTELLERLRERSLTCTELVEAHIARIREVNPQLNALIADRFDEARKEAAVADLRYETADHTTLPPLLGIPCSIKEFVATKGMPLTGGLKYRKDYIAEQDSTVVARLREAGAILLCISNVPEGGLWMETHNLLYGRTNNPWNPRHTSGGSSGGEGALVGSGATPFGIGSDIGGSIRIPAAFCGTVGHKPSAGLVPNTGHFPAACGGYGYMTIGPLCRRVGDVMPILRAIAGPDGHDAACVSLPLLEPEGVPISKLRVFTFRGDGRSRAVVTPVMRQAVQACAQALKTAGAQDGGELPCNLDRGFLMWVAALQSENPQGYERVILGDRKLKLLRELMLYPLGRSDFVLTTLLTMLSEAVLRRFPLPTDKWLASLHRLRAELDSQLGKWGVLIHPPYSRPAPRHRLAMLTPFHASCTAMYNALGYAVTVVPVGLDKRGLPVAVQVISRRGNDHVTLAAALVLEKHFGGFRLPEGNTSRQTSSSFRSDRTHP